MSLKKYLKNQKEVVLLILFTLLIVLGANADNARAEYLYPSTSCAASGSYSSYAAARAAVGSACSAGTGYSRGYVERSTSYSWECTGWNGSSYTTTANCSVSWPATTAPSVPSCTNSGGQSQTTTSPSPSQSITNGCGVQAGTTVKNGSTLNTSALCSTQGSGTGNITFNYLNNEWRWTCTSSLATATCKTTCEAGTNFCAVQNMCSKTCNDWCSNIEGNQTDRSKYLIDQYGACTEPKFITDFKLNPSISNSQGVCKVFWSTKNPIADTNLTCKINGAPVTCENAIGMDVVPGITKIEASLNYASTTYTDIKELRCLQNPNLIEI